ncbi:MAG: transposase mutator type, partial [Ilumatobacteraceae bacterium]|nr:transposase mutator type [Ilumatobacteraceae bacterium]
SPADRRCDGHRSRRQPVQRVVAREAVRGHYNIRAKQTARPDRHLDDRALAEDRAGGDAEQIALSTACVFGARQPEADGGLLSCVQVAASRYVPPGAEPMVGSQWTTHACCGARTYAATAHVPPGRGGWHGSSLWAKGLTIGEISAHLAEVYGTGMSKDTISTITDRLMAELTDWQPGLLDQERFLVCDSRGRWTSALHCAMVHSHRGSSGFADLV